MREFDRDDRAFVKVGNADRVLVADRIGLAIEQTTGARSIVKSRHEVLDLGTIEVSTDLGASEISL